MMINDDFNDDNGGGGGGSGGQYRENCLKWSTLSQNFLALNFSIKGFSSWS